MFLLPMSNAEMVVWPMLLSAVLLAAAGWAIALAVLTAVASFADTWWLAPYLAGNVALFQTISWLPMKRPELRALLAFAIVASIVSGPIAIGVGFLTAVPMALSYIAVMVLSMVACVRGVGRARHGLAAVGTNDDSYQIPDLPRFPSRVDSQVWLEEKRNGLVMKILTGMLVGLFALVATISVPTSGSFTPIGGVQVSSLALVWASLALVLPPYFGFGGCCASESDNVSKDRSLLPFMALRPLTTLQIVEAKVLASTRMALRLAVASVGAAFAILLLPTSTHGPYRPTIGALAHALTLPQALGILVAYGVVLAGGIKACISGIWSSLGRLPIWLMYIFAMLPLTVISATIIGLVTHPEKLPAFLAFLPNVIFIYAGLKLAALIPATVRLKRSGLVPESLVTRWFAGCAVTGVILFVLACWGIPSALYGRWAIAAQVFVFLPLLRVVLAPLFVARGRHG